MISLAWKLQSIGKTEEANSLTDGELLPLFGRLADGDMAALEALYNLCANTIYGLALWRTNSASDAADVVQEVFVRLAGSRTRLRVVSHPYRYILQIAHNVSMDILRARKPEGVLTSELILPSSNSPEAAREAESLSNAVQTLPPKQREAIYLRYFAELSFRDAARVSGVSIFTAASRCRLALQKLRGRVKG